MKSFPHRRLFRKGMRAVDSAMRTPDEDEREAKLDEAIAAFHAILVQRPELVRTTRRRTRREDRIRIWREWRNTMKSKLIMAAVIVGSFALAGCGGGGSSDSAMDMDEPPPLTEEEERIAELEEELEEAQDEASEAERLRRVEEEARQTAEQAQREAEEEKAET